MAQYDVFANPTDTAREAIPYFVDVQSDLLSELPTRLTLPLGNPEWMSSTGPANLCPRVQVLGQRVMVLPHMAAAFRTRELGRPVANLAGHSSEIVAALDAVLSGL